MKKFLDDQRVSVQTIGTATRHDRGQPHAVMFQVAVSVFFLLGRDSKNECPTLNTLIGVLLLDGMGPTPRTRFQLSRQKQSHRTEIQVRCAISMMGRACETDGELFSTFYTVA